jgi:hypothetical protein
VDRKAKGSGPNDKHEQRKQRHKELQEMSEDMEGRHVGNLLMMGDEDGGDGDY